MLLASLAVVAAATTTTSAAVEVRIQYAGDRASLRRPLPFATRQLKAALPSTASVSVGRCSMAAAFTTDAETDALPITLTLLASPQWARQQAEQGFGLSSAVGELASPEDFVLLDKGNGSIAVVATGGAGAMYGALELAERIATAAVHPGDTRSLLAVVAAAAHGKCGAARFGYRAVKINLPWSPVRAARGGSFVS